jgi:hypothetical protein
MITPLNLPVAPLKLTRIGDQIKVRCLVRNKAVILTPEEWVRQHVLYYMMDRAGYPKGRLAVEYELKYNGLSKRCDILIMNEFGDPFCIVECKASQVKLGISTLQQISTYNHILNARALIFSNGMSHFSLIKSSESHELLAQENIISWEELVRLFPT